MLLLVLAAVVAPVPEHHPPLAETLERIDRDATAVQNPALDNHERTRLAMEIREEGARVPALTVAQPPAVQKVARDLEQRTAHLFGALAQNDRRRIGREAGLLQEQVSGLRAAVAP